MKLRSGNLFALSAASEESEWFLAGKIANSCKKRKRERGSTRAGVGRKGGGFVAVSIPLAMLVPPVVSQTKGRRGEDTFSSLSGGAVSRIIT